MFSYSLDDFCTRSGAKKNRGDTDFSGCHFDSRRITPNMLFLAMQGEKSHGMNYVFQALQNGATAVLCDRVLPGEFPLAVHESPLCAIQNFARTIRAEKDLLWIGISGSHGKTTTKDALQVFLGEEAFASHENYNNFLGLPVCISCLPKKARIGIFEMGISTQGEMDVLNQILSPKIYILTSLSYSHNENFSSFSSLIQEKIKPSFLAKKTFMTREVEKTLCDHGFKIPGAEVIEGVIPCDFLRFGQGPAQSIFLAAEVARTLGVSRQTIFSRLEKLRLSPLRMERQKSKKGKEGILDCYNASPASMNAFLESLVPSKTVLVLGEMKELGSESMILHEKILQKALGMGFVRIYLLGEKFHFAGKDSSCILAHTHQEIVEHYKNSPVADVIAFKASRSLELEKIWEKLKKEV